jgi:uncharacterized protein YeaO (DUF488 family)
MTLRVVRLGTARARDEGLRIGTVLRPPRGVPKAQYQARNWYDAWLPELAPSAGAVKLAQAATTERDWQRFLRRYRAEMARPEKTRLLTLLAEFSKHTNLSVGCYCVDESRCHRSVLRTLLREHGAQIA